MTAADLTVVTNLDERDHQSEHRARVRFRQPISADGHIDAAWWPRTRDMEAELPGLLDVLWIAGRGITRITYNLGQWDCASRRMQVQGRRVHLGGFATSDPLTIRLQDPWGRERIDVLVIAPGTEASIADRAMEIAARSGSVLRAEQIWTLAGGADATPATVDPA